MKGEKLKSEKVGRVRLKQLGENYWFLRWRDPTTKKDERRWLKDTSYKKAKETAEHEDHKTRIVRRLAPGRVIDVPTIQDAFKTALRMSGARAQKKKDYANAANLFIQFLEEYYPVAKSFGDLRPSMIRDYLASLIRDGKTRSVIQMRLLIPRMAWRIMQEDYPDDVFPLPRLVIPKSERRAANSGCLDADEIATVLDWFKLHRPPWYAFCAVQALAGLRMLEVAALRVQDINFEERTVKVKDIPSRI